MKEHTAVAPCWRPLDVPRVANCKNCGRRIYAAVGDTFTGSQTFQVWRHYNRDSLGSSWCVLDSSHGIYTSADPDLSTLEWLRELPFVETTVRGYKGRWPIEIPFYRPTHRATPKETG